MFIQTRKGLFCPEGNFYIDPSHAVENAVITHAHSDHARRGSKQYYCTPSCAPLLKGRLGKNISVQTVPFGKKFYFGEVVVSFHSAGHILGSAQVRVEHRGEVWVASGDYKREPDPTCEPFEVVKCDVFVTEATFGTPTYRWKKRDDVGLEIFEWWQDNALKGLNSVLFAYSLGKAQRILGILEPYMERPIYCHPSTSEMTECYRQQGVRLAQTKCLSEVASHERFQGELILAPSAFLKSDKVAILNGSYTTAFASGWMARNEPGYDRGFVLSDHADWDDLVQTVLETEAKKIYVQHRGQGALVKHLRSLNLEAFPVEELDIFRGSSKEQLNFFNW